LILLEAIMKASGRSEEEGGGARWKSTARFAGFYGSVDCLVLLNEMDASLLTFPIPSILGDYMQQYTTREVMHYPRECGNNARAIALLDEPIFLV
jgi:hypothetical protein